MDGNFGNPASRSHLFGWKAEEVRKTPAARWPSWSTPTRARSSGPPAPLSRSNLAIKGAAHFYSSKGKHIDHLEDRAQGGCWILTRQLEREGFEVTYLEPGEDGLITPAMVEAVLREDTILVSIMHVNNESAPSTTSPPSAS